MMLLRNLFIPLDNLTSQELYGKVKVIVNGNWLGTTEHPHKFYKYLKDKKYQGIINIYTSVVFDFQEKEIIFAMMEED